MPNIFSLHAREEDKSGNNAVLNADVIFFLACVLEWISCFYNRGFVIFRFKIVAYDLF